MEGMRSVQYDVIADGRFVATLHWPYSVNGKPKLVDMIQHAVEKYPSLKYKKNIEMFVDRL